MKLFSQIGLFLLEKPLKNIWCKPVLLSLVFFGLSNGFLLAQSEDSTYRQLSIQLEIRPRAEFRNNFKLTSADSISPELYVSFRNRLTVNYNSRFLNAVGSVQEIHLFGKAGEPSSVGSVNFFELYLEPKFRNFSARIGRQGLLLDNGRMFSDAPWAQQSRSHEGVRLFYTGKKFTTDFSWAFTRPYSTDFDQSYSPVASHRYKYLLLHQLKLKLLSNVSLATINVLDAFENDQKKENVRLTSGGRLEYFGSGMYLTLNGFYQYGTNQNFKKITAYYLQPEIRKTIQNTTIRLGAEILSGDDLSEPTDKSKSFVPLYGVAWKFMGNMNFFTRFPVDVNSSGLVNPYLFILQKINSKLAIRADGHLFFSQHALLDEKKNKAERYLGFENDLSLNYKPMKALDINFGFSYLLAQSSVELLNKVENSEKIPVWSYLMVSFNTEIFRTK